MAICGDDRSPEGKSEESLDTYIYIHTVVISNHMKAC